MKENQFLRDKNIKLETKMIDIFSNTNIANILLQNNSNNNNTNNITSTSVEKLTFSPENVIKTNDTHIISGQSIAIRVCVCSFVCSFVLLCVCKVLCHICDCLFCSCVHNYIYFDVSL